METLGAARLAKEIPAQRAVATIVPREEITAALQDPEATPELFLRITGGGLEESAENVIAMTWSRDDLEGLLERATGENVVLTFDRDELSNAIGDVEAHGMRQRALVFAVVATGALGSGAAIANAMPAGDEGGPVVTSIAPAAAASDSMVTDASGGYAASATTSAADSTVTDVSSAGGYTAPAVEAAAADTMVSDAASGAGYAASATTSAADSTLTDVSSAGGYTAPTVEAAAADAMVSDAASGAGYAPAATEAGASAADSMRTDASSSGGYGTVESTGSGGGIISVHQPDTTDGLIAGGILLAIAGATFASRRGGTVRPA